MALFIDKPGDPAHGLEFVPTFTGANRPLHIDSMYGHRRGMVAGHVMTVGMPEEIARSFGRDELVIRL